MNKRNRRIDNIFLVFVTIEESKIMDRAKAFYLVKFLYFASITNYFTCLYTD
jgi:hypothetical protein